MKDSRNNILNESGGRYIEFLNTNNFSEGYYSLLGTNLRAHKTMNFNESHVLAGRFYISFVLGDPTFYDYSLIGGDHFARGYFYGRFRDQHFSTLQMEYRFMFFWRIGLMGFGGLSIVYNDFSNLNTDTFKPNGGLGMRFLADKSENTNLRIDYAVGAKDQEGFYMIFGESF